MNLQNIEVPSEKLLPELYFHGETYADQDTLIKLKEIWDVAGTALSRISDIKRQTEGRSEYSAKELNKTATEALKGLREFTDSVSEE